ncbi:uncharacterized protein [Triticum aestivum]|uniref:uncharacterized protein n=1 Tax=Triticum aestivum TaxID=4565 RepID=UPI001D02A9D3|nr:uncharacterized protein LOC123042560 [Triticum aestivum]
MADAPPPPHPSPAASHRTHLLPLGRTRRRPHITHRLSNHLPARHRISPPHFRHGHARSEPQLPLPLQSWATVYRSPQLAAAEGAVNPATLLCGNVCMISLNACM